MEIKIRLTLDFQKEFKKLSKKYTSLDDDIKKFAENLRQNPIQGKPLGKDCFKIRIKISSKNQGKSGGARIITCVKIVKQVVYLISIFDKSEIENLTDKDLAHRLKSIPMD